MTPEPYGQTRAVRDLSEHVGSNLPFQNRPRSSHPTQKSSRNMQDCPLYPPNYRCMSDNVISDVVVRHAVRRGSGPILMKTNYSPPRPRQPNTQRTQQCASHPVVHKTTRHEPASENDQGVNKLSPAEATLMLNRERRRLVQQRYRSKWKTYATGLEVSVVQLREDVQGLERTLQCMRPPNNMTESAAWNAVVEYFRLFRDGFKPSVPVSELCRNRAALCVDQAHTQAQFFQATLAPDVLSNAGYGLETALEDWRQVSMHHEDLTIELVQMRRGADNSVVAFMDGVTTITAGMLQNALPAFGGETNWESISARLIGQQILVPATVHFQWDNTTRRITSLCYVSDMLTPLLKLLGNLEDASRVLGTALDIQYWSKKISRQ